MVDKPKKKEQKTLNRNQCDSSCEKGKRDAASITNQHAHDIPPLAGQLIDKGDNILNPILDKREAMKREEQGSNNR